MKLSMVVSVWWNFNWIWIFQLIPFALEFVHSVITCVWCILCAFSELLVMK
jgi:ABC-type thiamin/hydroxymethylpyrimidine transport system permease subunit